MFLCGLTKRSNKYRSYFFGIHSGVKHESALSSVVANSIFIGFSEDSVRFKGYFFAKRIISDRSSDTVYNRKMKDDLTFMKL